MAYDTTPFQSTTSMAELADAIRNKAYGKDVREPIAQGFEQFDTVKGTVFVRLEAVEELVRGYEERIKQDEERIKQDEEQIKQLQADLKTKVNKQYVDDAVAEMKHRAEEVSLGVHQPTIERAVEAILRNKGVIN